MAEYIERESLLKEMHGLYSVPTVLGHQTDEDILFQTMVDVVKKQPTADVVPVVRCKDCKYFLLHRMACIHPFHNGWCTINDYCSYGERINNI